MNQSGKSYGVAVLRGLYVLLCSAMLLFVMETQAQAQSMSTRHVRQEVISGQPVQERRLPAYYLLTHVTRRHGLCLRLGFHDEEEHGRTQQHIQSS